MHRFVRCALIAAVLRGEIPSSLQAQAPATRPQSAGESRIRACSLVTRQEVKKLLPWRSVLDQFPDEEEAIGTTGSSCNYPSVFIQVMPWSPSFIDQARKKGGLEAVAGVGDEAYFHNNRNEYAEVYVKVGKHIVTLQSNLDGNLATVKPATFALAKALVAKLR